MKTVRFLEPAPLIGQAAIIVALILSSFFGFASGSGNDGIGTKAIGANDMEEMVYIGANDMEEMAFIGANDMEEM